MNILKVLKYKIHTLNFLVSKNMTEKNCTINLKGEKISETKKKDKIENGK